MSGLFARPVAANRTIRWQQILGFGQGSDSFWSFVRAHQLAVLEENLPLNVGLLSINVAAMVSTIGHAGDARSLQMFSVAVSVLGAGWLWRWMRQKTPSDQVSASVFWRISAEMLAFGLSWGALMHYLLSHASTDQQALLVMVSLIAMGAWAFATVVMPTAGLLLVAAIAGGTLSGLPAGAPLAHWLVKLAFATYVALIAGGMMGATARLMARLGMQSEGVEQSNVIALLLREFETNGSDWLFEVDSDGRVTRASARFIEVAGRLRETIVGSPMLAMLGDDRRGVESRAAVRRIRNCLEARQSFRDLVVPVPAGDETRWWQLSGTPKYDEAGVFAGYRGVGSDVTQARAASERMATLARFDALTGLANRSVVRKEINDALRAIRRFGGTCALLFIDLDRFKRVNDTLGHHAGDLLLCEVANRLREALGVEAAIGRLGGDEFAVVMARCDERAAEHAAGLIVETLARPFIVDGRTILIGASVGFAMGPADGASVDLLLRSADLALYEVKGHGRGHACRFDSVIQAKAEERFQLERDLLGAADRGELALAFQQVIRSYDERIVGFEALLRWHHPTLGVIQPPEFVPTAEEAGLIAAIGRWVIEEACRWAARWPNEIYISVNLSPLQFADESLLGIVTTALVDNDIDPDRLELVVNEKLFLNERASTIAVLASLTALGIRLVFDDLGALCSSLGYLHKAKFSGIKIHPSFVQRATAGNNESIAIIRAVVGLARGLGIATTAAGFETRAEFEFVRDLGCDHVQGLLFGRSMSPGAATALVTEMITPPKLTLVR